MGVVDVFSKFVDVIVHLDVYLGVVISAYGPWAYALLFLIVFAETGLVLTPFLPGDSLLFASGAFAAQGSLNVVLLVVLLCVAAIVGDTLNYWVGRRAGPRVFSEKVWFLKKDYLDHTRDFYSRHGGKTVILARFVPIVRTFAPFVAGVGQMQYPRFLFYNVVGALVWVFLFVLGGYFFGRIPWVEQNFTVVIFIIIGLSLIPPVVEYARHRWGGAGSRRSVSGSDRKSGGSEGSASEDYPPK